MSSQVNVNKLVDGDSTPLQEIRAQLSIVKTELESLQKRTGLFGSTTGAQAVTADSTTPHVIDLDDGHRIDVTTDGEAAANDLDVPAGTHGDEIFITLATRTDASDTVTITPDSGVTISTADLSATTDGTLAAVASITLDTAGEWAWLRYVVNRWIVVATTGAVA